MLISMRGMGDLNWVGAALLACAIGMALLTRRYTPRA